MRWQKEKLYNNFTFKVLHLELDKTITSVWQHLLLLLALVCFLLRYWKRRSQVHVRLPGADIRSIQSCSDDVSLMVVRSVPSCPISLLSWCDLVQLAGRLTVCSPHHGEVRWEHDGDDRQGHGGSPVRAGSRLGVWCITEDQVVRHTPNVIVACWTPASLGFTQSKLLDSN